MHLSGRTINILWEAIALGLRECVSVGTPSNWHDPCGGLGSYTYDVVIGDRGSCEA